MQVHCIVYIRFCVIYWKVIVLVLRFQQKLEYCTYFINYSFLFSTSFHFYRLKSNKKKQLYIFFMLGCKTFALINCSKSGIHGHDQKPTLEMLFQAAVTFSCCLFLSLVSSRVRETHTWGQMIDFAHIFFLPWVHFLICFFCVVVHL